MYVRSMFPKRLKLLREAIGASQEELAVALGVSRPTISYYERGERLPDIEVFSRIGELTGCSLLYLLGYSDYMNKEYGPYEDTGLSEKALEKLDERAKRFLDFFVCHDLFEELNDAANTFSISPGTSRADREMHAYLGFLNTRYCTKIFDDYARANMLDAKDAIYNLYESSIKYTARLLQTHKENAALNIEIDKIQELSRMNKARDLAEVDRLNKEQLEKDKFFRFYQKLHGQKEAATNAQTPEQ